MTMLEPCLDHVWPSLTSDVTIALILSRLSQIDLEDMPLIDLIFAPCKSYSWSPLHYCKHTKLLSFTIFVINNNQNQKNNKLNIGDIAITRGNFK